MVDGTQMTVQVMFLRVGITGWYLGHQLVWMLAKKGVDAAVDIPGAHTQVFVLAQQFGRARQGRVEHVNMLKGWGLFGEWFLCKVVGAQEFIDLTQPLLVAGNAVEKQGVPITGLHPCNGFYLVLLAGFCKIKRGGGVVDVGKYEGFDPHSGCIFRQGFG